MRIERILTFEEVLHEFRLQNPSTDHPGNTNRFAERALANANALTDGAWHKAELSQEDVASVNLPWHPGEGGKVALVQRTGLTVGGAAFLLKRYQHTYSRLSPVCWNKIARAREGEMTPIFLSTTRPSLNDYEDLKVRNGLFHLDGLHRMVAWELEGRLRGGARVQALIAGPHLSK